ncbi:MAG: polysaccharide deacetylase family protein [Thermodesulfobacteriota bacterium]
MKTKKAIVSVHDVMPENLTRIKTITDFLTKRGVFEITLLIVPGKNWSKDQINQLKKFSKSGFNLAGHGWMHIIKRKESFFHKFHSKLISRNEAEHLSLSNREIIDIIKKSYDWFKENGIEPPELYVPPAWAAGAVSKQDLKKLPYRFYEFHTGVFDSYKSKFYFLPIAGYMADTPARKKFIKIFNRLNISSSFINPVRIGIHPDDLNLGLAKDLEKNISEFKVFLSYSDLKNQKHL